jgi:hypothetical protein
MAAFSAYSVVSTATLDKAAGHPVDSENICVALSIPAGQSAELYFKAPNGEVRPFKSAYLAEIAGRRVSLCYIQRRSSDDTPYGAPQRGAVSVKVELWQPSESTQIYLFNNHQEGPQACKQRDFYAYQRFHEYGSYDSCLINGFHNPFWDFPTTIPEGKRQSFLFPPLSFLEKIWGPSDRTPVKRMSQIYNYAIPQDFSAVRIPFHFTAGAELSATRIIINDLLETPTGNLIGPVRVMIK